LWEVDNIPMRCELCGEEIPDEKVKHVHIKGKVKNICDGCVTAIKGFA
jgi:ribosome-binding protein aMBF1 (putative translation factor)